MRSGVLTVIIGLLSSLAAQVALGRPMDPALSRLVLDAGCASAATPSGCLPDRAAYHKLVSQWGFALAPHSVHGARTTGLLGFDVSVLAAYTGIDSNADYWRRGTEGTGALGAAPQNTRPDSWLQLYSLELRKGFGFGIEAGGNVGVMPHTSLLSWGADLRVALLEGMRHGPYRYLPDTSLGVGWREATGLGELALRTLAFDARISRQLSGTGGYVITPWLGYQWLRIDADSTPVDLSPGLDAVAECGFVGTNVPGSAFAASPDPGSPPAAPASGAPVGVLDGAPLCSGSAADFGNDVGFGEVDVLRQRLLLGVSYRRELLQIGAELITDLLRPDAAQSDPAVAQALRCDGSGQNCRPSDRQWTLVLALGASF
jgi:hypothetical protein